jgi:2-oxoglutarate ferredoxin oxidoreductase subunit alpha
MAHTERQLLLGNMACVHGAIYAGMRFYAGYPITPSTEVAEGCARELPKIGGRFIQMEDEIASMGAIVGASLAGLKAMTATSGPGYSLMVENIGYAYMVEAPCVIVNVQRGGPSTGLPTKVSQSDTMQARWGPHGDFTAIAVAPSTVADTITETIRAFNLAERFRTPVTILLDEALAHMRAMIALPKSGEYEVIDRERPTCDPADYIPFQPTDRGVNPMPVYGEGYRYYVTGLTHDAMGFPTNRPEEITRKLEKLKRKIEDFKEETVKLRVERMDDAEIAFVSYGSVSRAALLAVTLARQAGIKVGSIQLYTIWPFPLEQLRDLLQNCSKVIVGELNMGQIVREVERAVRHETGVYGIQRYDGEIITPVQFLEKLEEVQ